LQKFEIQVNNIASSPSGNWRYSMILIVALVGLVQENRQARGDAGGDTTSGQVRFSTLFFRRIHCSQGGDAPAAHARYHVPDITYQPFW
jgi:hypothetical protein